MIVKQLMLRWVRYIVASLVLVVFSASAYSQTVEDTFSIYFHTSSAVFDKQYRDNEKRAEEFFRIFNAFRSVSGVSVIKVEAIGAASPEGPVAYNEFLSKARMCTLRRIIRNKSNYPDSLIVYSNLGEDWEAMARVVENDPDVLSKGEVLDVIRNYVSGDKVKKLLTINLGRSYSYICDNIYPNVRAARITYAIDLSGLVAEPEFEEYELEIPDEDIFADLQVDSTLNITIPQLQPQVVCRIAVKSNAVGWGFGVPNIAAEIDLIPHLSINIPFYYSGGYDYFSPYVKFRGIVFQPEVRWYPWLKDQRNSGLFVGGHLGIGWYNFALNGDYRIQDANGNRPAFGGGLSVGYKRRFKKNPAWGVEFALGAGVYNAKYDLLYNEENGPYYIKGIKKTWFGVDNAAVSFFYDFDIKRRGGDRR